MSELDPLHKNIHHIPFERMRDAQKRWADADEIRSLVLHLTYPTLLAESGIVDAMSCFNLEDLGGNGKKEWLTVYQSNIADPKLLSPIAPRMINHDLIFRALCEVFDTPQALDLMGKLESGETVCIKVDLTSALEAHNRWREKMYGV